MLLYESINKCYFPSLSIIDKTTIRRKRYGSRQSVLVTKLLVLLLFFVSIGVSARSTAQKISISLRNAPLEKVIKEIQRQSNYNFVYNNKIISNTKRVDIDVKDVSIETALNSCLSSQAITYEISNRTIILKPSMINKAVINIDKVELNTSAPINISGVVKDSAGNPLESVSIAIKGTNKGAVTNANGEFSITVEDGDVLVIALVGYKSREIKVAGPNPITVTMLALPKEVEQVVVTALGIKRSEKALAYNVQRVKGDEVNRVPDASFVNALAGKVAGVTINASASGIGGSTKVVMRGTKSVFGNNNALYVLDGIPMPNLFSANSTYDGNGKYYGRQQSGDGISDLNADDIESMSILTGASAAALYGSQAANGAVLLTSKTGTKDRTHISLGNSTSFYSPFVLPKFQNTYGASAPGNFDNWGAKLGVPTNYDPADNFQTGYNTMSNVSLATGTEKSQTYISFAADNARGIIPNNTFKRYNLTFHQTNLFLDNRLKLDINVNYINGNNKNGISQGIYGNPLVGLYLFPRSDNIEKYQAFERYDVTRNMNVQYWSQNYQFGQNRVENPFWIMNREQYTASRERYLFTAGLAYKALDWLDLETRIRVDNSQRQNLLQYSASTLTGFTNGSDNGYLGRDFDKTKQVYGDFLIKAHNRFAKDFTFNGLLGATFTNTENDDPSFGGGLSTVPNLFSFNNVVNVQPGQSGYYDQSQSIFGSAEFGYKNLLFLTATGRQEWSSALANASKKSFFYPSVGVSAVISDILHLPRAISYLQLRGSYSEVGNTLPRYITTAYYPVSPSGFDLNPNLPLTTLQPERTRSVEIGLSSRFWGNKLNFEVTLYNTNTFNQFFTLAASPSSGIKNYYVNAGQVNNKGIEALLGGNVNLGNLKWSPTVVFSLNRNNVVKVIDNKISPIDGSIINQNEFPAGSPNPQVQVGKPIGELYVTGVQRDPKGYFVIDESLGTGPQASLTLDPNTYIDAGNANPRYNLGFRNGFTYNGFGLNFLIDYRNGGVVESYTQSFLDFTGSSATSAQARDNGGVVVNGAIMDASAYYKSIGNGNAMAFYVYSATNARLREASLSYTIPKKMLGKTPFGSVTLSFIGRNLFMFYNKAPFDPENTASTGTYYQGVDFFMLPSMRSYGFSVKVNL